MLDNFGFVGDLVLLPEFEIELQLSDSAEKKLKVEQESVIVQAYFSGIPKDTTLKEYKEWGEISIGSFRVELFDERVATFANVKQSVEQFDYDYRELMNRYRKGEVFASDTCDISQMLLTDVEWQYRYNPFGEPLKKNNYQPQWNERLGFIDKEKDRESKLGDHGVRKYDYEIGRFTSVDPRWEKYIGWTGYQYS